MLEPNEDFQNAIKNGTIKITELYDIELPTGVVLHFTTHSENIVWGSPSVVYYAQPIERMQIANNINLEMDTVQINIQNISGELYEGVNKNVLDSAKITIKLINWTDSYSADLETILFIGTADVEFDRKLLTLICKPILNSLNVVIPRQLYQEPCNHTLFDENCELMQSDFLYSGVTTSAGSNRLTVTDNNLKINIDGVNLSDVTLFNLGELKITSGPNNGHRRMIRSARPSNIIVITPFPYDVESGITFEAYPGCDKRVAETCDAVYGNKLNFLGFIYVPKIQEIL